MIAIPRVVPIVLPVMALVAAMAGLWSRTGSFGPDNAAFVMIVASPSLALPGLVLGLILLALDVKLPTRRPLWIGILLWISLATIGTGFVLGQSLDF